MKYEDKLNKVLEKLAEERKLTRKGYKTKVNFKKRTFNKIEIKDVYRILLKLQDDEKIINITSSLTPIDIAYPDLLNDSIADPRDYDLVESITVEVGQEFDKWIKTRKRIDFAMNNLLRDTVNEKPTKNKKNNYFIYQIKYGADQKIILNNLFELSKPNFDSENANVFELLYNNPNKKYTVKEIETSLGENLTKNLSKIIENLGFTRDLKKVFFQVSKTSVIFYNPISKKRLDSLDMKNIKL